MNAEHDDHDRATALRDRAGSEPAAVDVGDIVEILVCGDRAGREVAIDAYDTLVGERPDSVNDAAAALDAYLTHDSADVRCRGAKTARVLLERHPDAFDAVVPSLRSAAGDPSESAREPAVLALATLALERPDSAAPAGDVLCQMARARLVSPDDTATPGDGTARTRDPTIRDNPERDRRDRVRVRAIAGLTRIAAARPEAVREHAPEIGGLLEDEHHLVRTGACEILESLAAAFPDDVEPHASALAARIDADTMHPVPRRAAAALDALAEASPDRVGDDVASIAPALESLLEAQDPAVRRTGLRLLVVAARRDPAAVEGLAPTLRERVADDPDEQVRTLAERALERADESTSASSVRHERATESDDGAV